MADATALPTGSGAKKNPAELSSTGIGDAVQSVCLLRDNFGGLWSFLTHGPFKFDGLTFPQGFETLALNLGKVHETIFAFLRLDKTITFTFVKPLNFTFNHVRRSPSELRDHSSFKNLTGLPIFI